MSPQSGTQVAPRAPWLLSPTLDVFGILGSVGVSWLLYGLWHAGVLGTMDVVLLWIFVLHGPHFFATLSRTILSPEDRERWGPTYKRSLLWFLVGPVLVGAGLILSLPDIGLVFFTFAALWAFHHVVKQHFGFVALYRARNGVFDRADMKFTRYYLICSLWIPVLILMSAAPLWLTQLPGFNALIDNVGPQRAEAFVLDARVTLTWAFWALQAAYVGLRFVRLVRGQAVAWPELIVVAISVSLNWVVAHGILGVLMDPVRSQADPAAAYVMVPIITSYHNIQYHVLVWFYNRRRYSEGGVEHHGWAARLSSNLMAYALGGLAYTAVTIGIEYYPFVDLGTFETSRMFAALLWGVSFVHYWVDGKIWKVSEDRELQAALGFQRP